MIQAPTPNWCNQSRNITLIIIVLILFGVFVPLCIQFGLQFRSVNEDFQDSCQVLYVDIDKKRHQIDTLEIHLNELESIRLKALNELLRLDEQRVKLQTQLQDLKDNNADLEKQQKTMKKDLKNLKNKIELNKIDQKPCKIVENVIQVRAPQPQSFDTHENFDHKLMNVNTSNHCSYLSCIDYSRCSMVKPFKFHVYKPLSTLKVITSYYETLTQFQEFSNDKINSCFYVVFISIGDQEDVETINKYFLSLPSWKNTGINHMVFVFGKHDKTFCRKANLVQRWQSIFVLPQYCEGYNSNFGFLFSDLTPVTNHDYWSVARPIIPVEQKISVLFNSEFLGPHKNVQFEDLKSEKKFSINTNCNGNYLIDCPVGWCPCSKDHVEKLKISSYRIIITGGESQYFFTELIESLQYNVVPILLGDHNYLPFSNLIEWTKACILLPSQRITELPYVIQTLPIEDVVALKKQGRFLYEKYFLSQDLFLKTILSSLRHNIGVYPLAVGDIKTELILQLSYSPDTQQFMNIKIPSRTFRHNFSYVGQKAREIWNRYPGGLQMYPMQILSDSLPSEFQFSEEGKDSFMPIGDGKGGDGVAFQRSLGGDYPIEQFTVLLLTYDRPGILMEALQRLSGMKYLNKVVVLWNHPVDPTPDITWPDIGVQIEVVRTGRNSLNNRFIPYDTIETEAILSVDDDVYLRHDEIELAFRVWRENRDRLVGFPGRHHSYNSTIDSFYYDPFHACELSLVLTGAAFFHKYYSYMYTYEMHSSIREIVDEYMNCEDIALNYLVAHITQKPPIKVTSRWTFRCPGCPVALSAVSDHFAERSNCMAFFQKIYGYNPLKRTQFRADSILFKTRIPSSMTKCFQYV